jgi:heat shock protein HslJ
MKKLIMGLGFALLLTVGLWAFFYRVPQSVPVVVPEPVATTTPIATSTAAVHSLKNATYSIEGIPVTLVNGTAETPAAPGSASMIETNYFGNEVNYDFNNDGRMDTVFLLTQSTGGTGVFYYVVAALNLPDGYHGSEGVRLGDRIAPQTTRMSTESGRVGVVEVTYADRASSDSFAAAPSIGKSLLLKFDPATMQFGTVEPSFEGEANPSIMKLTQKKWQWVRTNYTDGRVFVPKMIMAFSLTFSTDGKVSGTTDCNSLGGPYTTAGTSSLIFGRMATTRMYCDGSEEGVFDDLLGQVATYSFTSKGELYLGLKANSGTMILQ